MLRGITRINFESGLNSNSNLYKPKWQETGASGRSVCACVARESKLEKNGGVGRRAMRLMGGWGVWEWKALVCAGFCVMCPIEHFWLG